VGLPQPIDSVIGTDIHAHSERLNYDHTVTPTMLLHLGAGWSQNWLGRPPITPDYDAVAGLGLKGPFTHPATFPVFQGLCQQSAGVCVGQGGMANIGSTASPVSDVFQQFSSIVSLTWVKNNHTFKFGGELRNQGDYNINGGALNGTYGFSSAQTALPYLVSTASASPPVPLPSPAAVRLCSLATRSDFLTPVSCWAWWILPTPNPLPRDALENIS
jgi:hypothetical protein